MRPILSHEQILELVAALAPATAPSAGLLAAITAHMPAILALLDLEGAIVWVNQPADESARAAVIGRSMFDYMPPGEQAGARAALERVLATGQPDRYIGYGPGRSGPRSRYESWISPIARDGDVIALVLVTHDVSEEWALYEALRDREERLSVVLRAAGMGMWRFDLRTRTVECDEHARAIYGMDVGRMDALAFTSTYIHPDDRAEVDARALASVVTRRPYANQNRILRSDGAPRWVEVTGSPILDEHGDFVGLMGTVADITERREVEDRARQAQRLDAVGQLTAGIAHNFNNFLAAILPTLTIVERDVGPTGRTLVRRAYEGAERAADLVRQLMTFAGRNRGRTRTVEAPGVLVERTVQLCSSTFERGITLELEVAPDLPAIRVDVGQFEQAVLNLLLNARDAVRELGGARRRVHVRVGTAPRTEADGPTRVAVVVVDNGPGVPEAIREQIFDPFFTTKSVGQGTGLGLSTAYAIAREHGGTILYASDPGGGARFTLIVPSVDAAPTAARAPARSPALRQGTVLVVDDDEMVLETVALALRGLGFSVLEATGVDPALAVLAGAEVDAVLLDLNMPGRSWRELVAALRRDRPRVKVVAFTGGTTPPEAGVDGWLAKPAHPEAIADVLTRVIGA